MPWTVRRNKRASGAQYRPFQARIYGSTLASLIWEPYVSHFLEVHSKDRLQPEGFALENRGFYRVSG
jgi:hypothetical protein